MQNKVYAKYNLEELELALKYIFKDKSLLIQALTHTSYGNEAGLPDYERLEYLGDAVLELIISASLWRKFDNCREGELTKFRSQLVNETSLALIARNIKLQQYLLLGKGEESQGGRHRNSMLADSLEALFGAIFLDSDFYVAKECILRLFSNQILKNPYQQKDNKTLLQEITQKIYKDRPNYIVVDSKGPEHNKIFKITVELKDVFSFSAEAPSLRKAEQIAAGKALIFFKNNPNIETKK